MLLAAFLISASCFLRSGQLSHVFSKYNKKENGKILPDISGWINGNLDCLVLQLSRETPTLIFLKDPIFSYKAWSHENNSLGRCLNQTSNCFRLLGAKRRNHEAVSICLVSWFVLNNCSHFEQNVNWAYWFLLKWCHHLCFLIIIQSVSGYKSGRMNGRKMEGGWSTKYQDQVCRLTRISVHLMILDWGAGGRASESGQRVYWSAPRLPSAFRAHIL